MLKNELYVVGEGRGPEIPLTFNFGQRMLECFMNYNDDVALIYAPTGERVTYSALAQKIVDVALSLQHAGVKKGQVIGVCKEEHLDFVPTLLGIICTGAVCVPIDLTKGVSNVIHEINTAKPVMMFCSGKIYEEFKEVMEHAGTIERYVLFGDYEGTNREGVMSFKEFLTVTNGDVKHFEAVKVDGRDDAVIMFSSGTTSLPKCIPETHINMLFFVANELAPGYYKGKALIVRLGFFRYTLRFMYAGAIIVHQPKSTDSVRDVIEAIAKTKTKIIVHVPNFLLDIVKNPDLSQHDVSSLECICCIGAPLTQYHVTIFRERFPKVDIRGYYGSKEVGVIGSCLRPEEPTGLTVEPTVVVKVVDLETRLPVGANMLGEICTKGPGVFPGYLGDTTFSYFDEEGFFKTGDFGYYDEAKSLYILERIADLITCNGHKVVPMDLEAVLNKHDAVKLSVAVGIPDAVRGEAPVAFAVLEKGADISADVLLQYVNGQVADWMKLLDVKIVENLPHAFGKVNRKALREILTKMST